MFQKLPIWEVDGVFLECSIVVRSYVSINFYFYFYLKQGNNK